MAKNVLDSEAEAIPVTTGDGLELVVHRLGDLQAPGALFLTGAFSNHTFWLGTRGVGLARYLAQQGFCSYVLDFRGHGFSQCKPPEAQWSFEDWANHDIPAALAVASAHGPVHGITHSASGAAILTCLTLHAQLLERIASLTIVATPAPHLASFRRLFALVAFGLCHLLGRFPARALGFGPEDEDGGVMAQWLGWNLNGRWETRQGVSVLEDLPSLPFPLLAVAGSGDWLWAPPTLCRKLYESVAAPRKEFWEMGPANGCTTNPGHGTVLVSPECRKTLWPRLARWLATFSFQVNGASSSFSSSLG